MNTLEIALLCLSINLYNEARGEPLRGQQAVAEVTLRRVDDTRWANTVCGVVYQPYQFSWTLEQFDIKDEAALTIAEQIAYDTYFSKNKPITKCADHYYNPTLVNPYWASSMKVEVVIGNHIFLCSEE